MATLRSGIAAEPTSGPLRSSANGIMQLPDEAVEYAYTNVLAPPASESWTPLVELQAKNLLGRQRLQALVPSLMLVRGQVASEREMVEPKPEQLPLHAGFIDLPLKTLESHRRKGDASELGRAMATATRLRDETDRVVVLGAGGATLGPRALFRALLPAHHNELPTASRMGRPRLYFEDNGFDGDATQDLLDMFENTCIDPELREERWGLIASGKNGEAIETSIAFRRFRAEAARFYGSHSPRLKQLIAAVTGTKSPLREVLRADGYGDEDMFQIPDNVGGRFSVFTPAGLLPAAVMGLDVRALLLGAAAMTRRFLEEPFERNPVLQFAAVNFLVHEELHKSVRVMAVWSPKLESLGHWHDHLVAESLGKQGKGPTPLTIVMPRDAHVRGQQLQDGPRDKVVINLVVRGSRTPPQAVGMADRNEDGLNAISRKTYADLQTSAMQASSQALRDAARPSGDIVLPTLSEHTLGQLMQMLMLATVVEARLMGINPYSDPGARQYKANLQSILGLS
jgi:glucose-6-phosphate isomerase